MPKEIKNKSIYQIYREECGLTREEASIIMGKEMETKRLERIEYGQMPTPYDICIMANAYKKPEMKIEYCNACQIGKNYIPPSTTKDLSQLALKTLNSITHLNAAKDRISEICEDGKISKDELEDFNEIRRYLENISSVASSLKMWMDTFTENAE